MQANGDTMLASGDGAATLHAFCAHALDDLSLQAELQQPDCADESAFLARLLDLARQRGFALTADVVSDAMRRRPRELDGAAAVAVEETPLPPEGWLPIRAFWQAGELFVRWGYFGARRLREPFFEGDVRGCLAHPFNRLFGYVTAVDKLSAWLDQRPHLQPSGFVFHMSRCGSTLVAQMLAAVESNIVVSEASAIDAVVQAHLGQPDLGDERQCGWLRSIVGALGQQRCGDERRYFIKLDCWHSVALPLFRRAFPAVPWIFLYRDPVEVMVSQLQMPGLQMLPQGASDGGSGGAAPTFHGIERAYGPDQAEDFYARVLAKICEPIVQHCGAGGGLLVNYRELPDATFSKILPHFGVTSGHAERTRMMEAARFAAKAPSLVYSSDSAVKQRSASPAVRAAAERWLADIYGRLEAVRAAAGGDIATSE